jgi:hypothetical protein
MVRRHYTRLVREPMLILPLFKASRVLILRQAERRCSFPRMPRLLYSLSTPWPVKLASPEEAFELVRVDSNAVANS